MTETIKPPDDEAELAELSEQQELSGNNDESTMPVSQPQAEEKPWGFLPPHMDHPELI